MCIHDARKRAPAAEEPSRPQKRRSRDHAPDMLDRASVSPDSAAVSFATTIVAGPEVQQLEPPATPLHWAKEPSTFIWEHPYSKAHVDRSRLPTDQMQSQSERDAIQALFVNYRRRLSETLSRTTKRFRESIVHSKAPRDETDNEKSNSSRQRAKSFSLRSYDSTLVPSAGRPFEFGPSPPMRTSSLDHNSPHDSSSGLAARQYMMNSIPRRRHIARRDSNRAPYLQESDRESGISLTPEPEAFVAKRKLSQLSFASACDPADRLPDELMIEILCYLDARDLDSASQTSTRWHKLTSDQHVLMNAFLRKYAPKPLGSPLPAPVGGRGIGMVRSDGSSLPGQHWERMYSARKQLDRNWLSGRAQSQYLFGHTDSVYCVQFDEHKAITGSRDRTIRVWDLHKMTCIKVIGGPNAYDNDRRSVNGAVPEFTEHMTRYLESSGRCRWHVYPDRSAYHVPSYYHCASILCLQYDDEIMVTGSSDSTLIIWDIKTFEPMHVLRRHRSGVLDLAFDADKIVSCSKDFTICVWDRRTGDFLHQIEGHQGPVNAVQLRGNLVVSASGEGSSHLYNLNFTRTPSRIPNEPAKVSVKPELVNEFWSRDRGLACIEFSDDAKHVIAGGNDHLIFKYDTSTATQMQAMQGHEGLVRSLYLDGANGRIISGSYDMSIKVWDFATGDLIRTYANRTTSWMLSAKSDYRRIVATSQDGRVAILDFGAGVEGVELLEGR